MWRRLVWSVGLFLNSLSLDNSGAWHAHTHAHKLAINFGIVFFETLIVKSFPTLGIDMLPCVSDSHCAI